MPKKADAFSAKEDSLRSAPRGLWPLRHSLRAECFSDVHAAGKTISFSFAACGKTTASEEAEALSGSCIDILNKVYETADLDASMRDAMQDYEMTTIDADMEEYVLGTDEITYTDSAYSAPMMTSVAYQCVVLRVPDGTDVPKAKQTLLDNANPAKWICVEAESVAVESIGDVILYVMGFDEDVSAIKDAFLALDE